MRAVSPATSRDCAKRAQVARGLWYDALESLADAVDSDPTSRSAGVRLGSLLRQGGFEAALP